MREILFRGKRVDNGEWVEGWHYKRCVRTINRGICTIGVTDAIQTYDGKTVESIEYHFVVPETLSRCTGMRDKNGKLIFEGDVLSCQNGLYPACSVIFNEFCAAFQLLKSSGYSDFFLCSINHSKMEIIGNIHDNPELIAEVQDG